MRVSLTQAVRRAVNMLLARRSLIAIVIGIAAGLICALFQAAHPVIGTDALWAVDAGRALLAGQQLYRVQPDIQNIPYPLTAVLALLPFTALPNSVAGPLFMALMSALLAWALLPDGVTWRLMLFASPAFMMALMFVQWSPLLCAVALLPALTPLALCKPTVGLALIAPRLTWRRALACAAFGALTLLVDPAWPLLWYRQTRAYYGFIPLLLLPAGPLMALAALRWRDRNARWLLLLACVPQQLYFYDALALWLMPSSRRQMLVLLGYSWMAFFFVANVTDFRSGPQATVLGCYLPALVCVLWPATAQQLASARTRSTVEATAAPRSELEPSQAPIFEHS